MQVRAVLCCVLLALLASVAVEARHHNRTERLGSNKGADACGGSDFGTAGQETMLYNRGGAKG
jgi:hypothetical protein